MALARTLVPVSGPQRYRNERGMVLAGVSGPEYSERSHSADTKGSRGGASWESLPSRAAVDGEGIWEEWTADGQAQERRLQLETLRYDQCRA